MPASKSVGLTETSEKLSFCLISYTAFFKGLSFLFIRFVFFSVLSALGGYLLAGLLSCKSLSVLTGLESGLLLC